MPYAVAAAFSSVAQEVVHGSALTELVSGDPMTEEGTITLGNDADGDYIQAGTSAGLLFPNQSSRVTSSTGVAYVFIVKVPATLQAQGICGVADSGSTIEFVGINLDNLTWTQNNGELGYRSRNTSSVVNSMGTANTVVATNTLLKVCIARPTTQNAAKVWVNGTELTPNSLDANASWSSAGLITNLMGLLQVNSAGTRQNRGDAKLYFFARLLNGNVDGASLSSNPYQIVEETGGDTTAPVLTSPTGTATGSTTATVGATTDEGNGTLYAFVSTSGTPPSAADLKAGTGAAWAGSQAVSSTGAKTLNATGLPASTALYAHLIHTDAAANDSNIVSSAQFTTSAPASPPTITDQPDNATVKRGQTATFTITASGATSYQWERDTGSGYADISGATSASYTTPATTMADNADLYRCKATNADGTTTSSAATLTVQQCVLALNAAGYEFGDGNSPATMAVLASTELQVAAYPLAEWPPASAVATATSTTSSVGRLADLGDDDLIFGATYRVIARNATTGETWAWTMDAT